MKKFPPCLPLRVLSSLLALLALAMPAFRLLCPATSSPFSDSSPAAADLLGTAWYPEQWPESRWDADLA